MPIKSPVKKKNPAAVALGRLGGLKGGKATAANRSPRERSLSASNAAKARMEKLSPEERKKIAQNAIRARWKKKTS